MASLLACDVCVVYSRNFEHACGTAANNAAIIVPVLTKTIVNPSSTITRYEFYTDCLVSISYYGIQYWDWPEWPGGFEVACDFSHVTQHPCDFCWS